MSMFNDISCEGKDNRQQCLRDADYVKTLQRDLELVNGLSLDQVPEKKWYPSETTRKANGTVLPEDYAS